MRVEEKRILAVCLFLSLLLASGLLAITVFRKESKDLLPSKFVPRLTPENEMPDYFMKVGKAPEWKDLIILTKLGEELVGPDVPFGGTLVVAHGVGADGYYWVWFHKDKMTQVNQNVITTIVEEVNRVAGEIGFTGELPIKFAISGDTIIDRYHWSCAACMQANMAEENELHPYVPFDELPENIKLILSEYVSPPTLELIKSGRPPNEEMIRAGVRRESFFGGIYPVYHEFGAVYIFNGSGSIVHVNGGVDTVNVPEGVITVGFSWSTEYLESIMGKRGPPSLPDTTPSFPTTLIVATTVIAAIAVVGSALLVYFTKIKKTTEEIQ